MTMAPDPTDLEGLVTSALAEAHAGGPVTGAIPPPSGVPHPAAAAVPSQMPAPGHQVQPQMPPWLSLPPTGSPEDVDRAMTAPGLAMHGDRRAVETLALGMARRDPVAGTDPLPLGRDSVTFATAAISTRHDPAQHSDDLMAFRASEDYPRHDQYSPGGERGGVPSSLQYAPTWLANRVGDAPASGTWPERPPHESAGHWGPGDFDQPPTLSPSTHRPFAQGSGHALEGVRGDFPALQQKVNGHPLVWLDNGATTHKPNAVIDAVSRFYQRDNSNVHRGAHTLAARATDAYEGARQKVQRYLGAHAPEEIVFVRGATEAINLVAQAWGRENIRAGDEILLTHLEHHANIVPWQQLATEKGASLRVVPVDDDGNLRLDAYEAMLSPRVKIVAMPQVANAIGTVLPVAPMAAMAHRYGARVLVDGAQSAAHVPVDVPSLGADFFVFSGHKVYGPTGIGVLWARREVLESMPPWQGGGSMIKDVTFERTIYADPPAKFEAGTPNLAGAVGLGAALEYIDAIGRPQIAAYEHMLLEQTLLGLRSVPGLSIVGEPMMRAAVVSFVMAGRQPSEVAKHLDRVGIAVRSGHHCAQPILRRLGLEETVRASLGVYNVPSDIDRLVNALKALGSSQERKRDGAKRSTGPTGPLESAAAAPPDLAVGHQPVSQMPVL